MYAPFIYHEGSIGCKESIMVSMANVINPPLLSTPLLSSVIWTSEIGSWGGGYCLGLPYVGYCGRGYDLLTFSAKCILTKCNPLSKDVGVLVWGGLAGSALASIRIAKQIRPHIQKDITITVLRLVAAGLFPLFPFQNFSLSLLN